MSPQHERTQDTKKKIMEVAFELFGLHGFEGTSIREISKISKVNLAAINYHFQSKDNLFWEIMAVTYQELDQEIKTFSESSNSVVELAMKTYDYYLSEKTALKNIMKMMLTDMKMPDPLPPHLEALNNPMGPPGGQYFAEMIAREVPYSLSREGTLWGVKAIFGVVHHWGVMCTCPCVMENDDPLMSEEQIRSDVQAMVESHMLYLSHNKKKFGA